MDTAGGETAVSQYRIYRTTALNAPLSAPYTTVIGNLNSWTDPDGVMVGGGTFFYNVTAMNTAGESALSNRVGVFGFPINLNGN